jgi:hypothetical protein
MFIPRRQGGKEARRRGGEMEEHLDEGSDFRRIRGIGEV